MARCGQHDPEQCRRSIGKGAQDTPFHRSCRDVLRRFEGRDRKMLVWLGLSGPVYGGGLELVKGNGVRIFRELIFLSTC